MNRIQLKKRIDDLRALNSTPHQISLGFSIGTFIAILPTFGLGVLIGLIVVLVKKDINKLALFAAFAIWNPIILIPINTIAFQIGDLLLLGTPVVEYDISIANQIFHFTRRLLIGNIIISMTLAGVSYFLVQRITKIHQSLMQES